MDGAAMNALRELIVEKDKQWAPVRSALVLDHTEDRRELFGSPLFRTGGGYLLDTPSMTQGSGAILRGPRVHGLDGCTVRLWLYGPSNLATGGPRRDYSEAVSDLDEVTDRLMPLLLTVAGQIPAEWPVPIGQLVSRGDAVVVAAHAMDRPPESPWWRAEGPASLAPVDQPGKSGVFVRYPSCGVFAMLGRLLGQVPSSQEGEAAIVRFSHADDFSWIVWDGVQYQLPKGQQTESVRALWDSWEKGGRRNGCGLSEATVGTRVGSENDNFRLAHAFRHSRLWGRVIRPTGKGTFALFSESPQNPSC